MVEVEGSQILLVEEEDETRPVSRAGGHWVVGFSVTFGAFVALACIVSVSHEKGLRSHVIPLESTQYFLLEGKGKNKSKKLKTSPVKRVEKPVSRICSAVAGVQVTNSKTATSVWKGCSAKWEEDCSQTGCCRDWGMKCYRKNSQWAACTAECKPKDEKNETWLCDVLEPEKPRSAEGCMAECRKMHGCKQSVFASDTGGRCHLSEERITSVTWAGDAHNSSFCGDSNEEDDVKKAVDEVFQQLPFRTEYPEITCSWSGEDCSETKCCNDYLCDEDFNSCQGYSCWKKDKYFSGCLPTPAEGWDGTWIGGVREHRVLPPAGEHVAVHGNSLYCFTVVTWSAPRPKPFWNSEKELANNWRQWGLHVLQCDGSDILDGIETPVAEWGSFSNIDMFMEIWQKVNDIGKWKNYDWTVKVDSDAVFFPERLKQHLWNLRTPAGARVYLENINFKFKFMGAIEIMTTEALAVFLEKGKTCIRGKHEGGEDSFLKTCLDGLGIDHQSDWTILRDKYAALNPPCYDGWAVAYHYMKKMHDWSKCYNEVMCGYGEPKEGECDKAIPVPGEIPMPNATTAAPL